MDEETRTFTVVSNNPEARMPTSFRVVIVGGSVSGLTLAHCLDRLGVDFVLFERHEQIAPQLGASLGILPNGARILDQLGLFDDIEEHIEPLEFARIRYTDGFRFGSQYPKALHESFGYPLSFLERRLFLQILYNRLPRKERVHTNKKVVSIQLRGAGALVETQDGQTYPADLVIGADGVRSLVRSEVWRLASEISPDFVTDQEKSSLRVEYACVYGISKEIPDVTPGVQRSLLDDDLTIHLINGEGSQVFWFLIYRLPPDRRPEGWQFGDAEAMRICEKLASKQLDETLSFGDIWSRCSVYKLTPLEEGMFLRCHFGRLLCIGDAIRKMAPNIGQGANMAIEDAAVLANLMSSILQQPGSAPSASEIELMLHEFTINRRGRTKAICDHSEFLVRMQANHDMVKRLLGRYLVPFLEDVPAGLSGSTIEGAPKLNFLSLPQRALAEGWHGSFYGSLRSLKFFRPRIKPGLFFSTAAIFIVAGIVLQRDRGGFAKEHMQ